MVIPFHKPYIDDEEYLQIKSVLDSGWLTMGKKTLEFEDKVKNYIGNKYVSALNSATSALHLSLICAGIKRGDEVIIPVNTFVATAEAVLYCGGVPVFCDIDKNTGLIDTEKIELLVTKKTKAIISVDYAGQPCDYDKLEKLAGVYNLKIINDAAHSFSAKYKSRMIGSISDYTCFSFYVTKPVCTGEGGVVSVKDPEDYDRIQRLRLHGISKDAWKRYDQKEAWEYDVAENGYKYNPTDLSMALGIAQMNKIELMNEKREGIFKFYQAGLKGNELIETLEQKPERESSHHLFVIKLKLEKLKISRDRFIEILSKEGIKCSVHFIPLTHFNFYINQGWKADQFPQVEDFFRRIISIPIFPSMTDSMRQFVLEKVIEIAKLNLR